MPRFFFDTYDGDQFTPDEVGLDLDGLEAAKAEGQKVLPDMARDRMPDDDQRVFMVNVRDEAGQMVLRIALAMRVEYAAKAQD